MSMTCGISGIIPAKGPLLMMGIDGFREGGPPVGNSVEDAGTLHLQSLMSNDISDTWMSCDSHFSQTFEQMGQFSFE